MRTSAARIFADGEDRPDRDVRVARRDQEQVRAARAPRRRPERAVASGAPRSGPRPPRPRWPRATNQVLKRKRAGGRVDQGAQRRRRSPERASRVSPAPTRAARSPRRAVAPSRRACVRTRCRPRSRSPSENQASPPSAATVSSACHDSSGATPAALLVGQAGERVEHAVEIRARRAVRAPRRRRRRCREVTEDGAGARSTSPRRNRAPPTPPERTATHLSLQRPRSVHRRRGTCRVRGAGPARASREQIVERVDVVHEIRRVDALEPPPAACARNRAALPGP